MVVHGLGEIDGRLWLVHNKRGAARHAAGGDYIKATSPKLIGK
jgi:hypothetical protein